MPTTAIIHELNNQPIDVLAREVTQHSNAAGLPTAWNSKHSVAANAYDNVIQQLIWPGAPTSTFKQCCERIQRLSDLL